VQARKQVDDAWRSVDEEIAVLDTLAPRWNLQANRDRLGAIKEEVKDLKQTQEVAVELAAAHKRGAVAHAAKVFAATATPRSQKVRQLLKDTVESQFGLLAADEADLASDGTLLNRIILIATLAAVVIGCLVAALISRRLSAIVAALLARAEAIARGDLTGRDIEVRSRDELGDLALAINKMEQSLRQIVDSILANTERLASASEQLSATATQQSAGAEAQKDQAGHVAVAMQQMSTTIVEISQNSSRAADAARKASDTARAGGKIVEDTLSKMREIAASVGTTAQRVSELGTQSNQIGQIIGVIDDIADQTNLLALNAAIEAARAGEQGRGFAVVADEVRKLAERTSKATKEISRMIHAIQDETKSAVLAMESGTAQVQAGVATTTQAGSSLHDIIQSAEQVGDMVTHIATAATQQSSTATEVNSNIEQIAKITAESAIGAQQSAKACHDLSNLALELQKIVGGFHLDSDGSNGYRASRAAAGATAPSTESPAKKSMRAKIHAVRVERTQPRVA
jgi:methyl-accepting chemotaxis protein